MPALPGQLWGRPETPSTGTPLPEGAPGAPGLSGQRLGNPPGIPPTGSYDEVSWTVVTAPHGTNWPTGKPKAAAGRGPGLACGKGSRAGLAGSGPSRATLPAAQGQGTHSTGCAQLSHLPGLGTRRLCSAAQAHCPPPPPPPAACSVRPCLLIEFFSEAAAARPPPQSCRPGTRASPDQGTPARPSAVTGCHGPVLGHSGRAAVWGLRGNRQQAHLHLHAGHPRARGG